MPIKQFIDQGAVFSEDRKHRFRLFYEWDETLPRMILVMLNPSKADGAPDSPYCLDPTMRRTLDLAAHLGFGAVDVVNFYSIICTDSRELHTHVGDLIRVPDTDRHISDVTRRSGVVVCGWGKQNIKTTPGQSVRLARSLQLQKLLAGAHLWCFGTNMDGSPKHPLYLPRLTKLEPWHWL